MEQNNWKAWVDSMPSPTPRRPLLHVHGNFKVSNKAHYDIALNESPSLNDQILLLKVYPTPTQGVHDYHAEYNEEMENVGKYKQVQIIVYEGEHPITIDVEQVS